MTEVTETLGRILSEGALTVGFVVYTLCILLVGFWLRDASMASRMRRVRRRAYDNGRRDGRLEAELPRERDIRAPVESLSETMPIPRLPRPSAPEGDETVRIDREDITMPIRRDPQ